MKSMTQNPKRAVVVCITWRYAKEQTALYLDLPPIQQEGNNAWY